MKKLLFLFIICCFSTAHGQTILTIDEALALALKNNYDITIAKNEALISQKNNTAGAAGMLPNISISGSGNYALRNNRNTDNITDNVTEINNSVTSLNAGAELSWTLFDGGKMFVTKAKLNEIQALGEIQFKQQVLQTLSEVISSYYNIVKQEQQLSTINQIIKYNQERVKIAETGFNSGSGNKTDLLQAKIDLNVNMQNAINQESAILMAKRELSRLLVVDKSVPYEVSKVVDLSYTPDSIDLQKNIYAQNNSVLAYVKGLEIDRLALKESYRSLLPRVNFNAGYYFQNIGTLNMATQITGNSNTIWPQIGGSISIPVFQGGNLQRQVALSKINVDIAQNDLDNLKLQVNTDLLNALTTYKNQKKLLVIEYENNELAKENLEISLHRMRLGEATSLEVRMAQTDFEQSSTRLINFQYNLKMAETRLKQLMGEL